MTPTHTPQPIRRRAGYTLLEMILVLMVLAVVSGVTLPMMVHVYANSQLKRAVEQVRVKLASTRVRAVDTGLTYQFRYEPEGRHFVVIPFERLEGNGGVGDADTVATETLRTIYSGQLPEEMFFRGAIEGQPVGKLGDESFVGMDDARQLADVDWSIPVLFFSDGSSTQAAFEVHNDNKQFIQLAVRDLTGSVRVGEIRQRRR